jgi:hypothetical protein
MMPVEKMKRRQRGRGAIALFSYLSIIERALKPRNETKQKGTK